MVVMVMGFNPIQDGDWQGLNIALEKLFFTNAEAKSTKVTTKKTGSVSARKTVTIKNDASSEIADGNNIDVKIQGVDDGQGIALYVDGGADDNVTIPDTGIVYKTQAKIAVPSSYFLDLRGVRATTVTMQYTADYLTLHNAAGETLALTNVSETNNINTAGPVAGGRDQVGAFGDWVWVHFFIIYNPTTGDVSSLSSLSPTAPTLPTGYTYFVRVGCNLKTNAGILRAAWQIGDRFYHGDITSPIFEAAPDLADISQSLDISNHIPTTAKVVHGTIGTSSALPGMVGVGVSAGASSIEISFSLASGDAVYGLTGAEFTLPVLTTQTIWWRAHTTDAIYAMSITGFQDDL